MTEERQHKQEEQPSIQTQLNDLQEEVRRLRSALERHVAQQRKSAKAARPAEHTHVTGNAVEAARIGILQLEEAILDCLSKGVRPADITHRLRLPIDAPYFLQHLAAQNRVSHVAHGQYELIQNPQK